MNQLSVLLWLAMAALTFPLSLWMARACMRAVLRVLSPAESDSLLGVPAAASLDDDRALYRDTEWPAEQVEKFKPYSIA